MPTENVYKQYSLLILHYIVILAKGTKYRHQQVQLAQLPPHLRLQDRLDGKLTVSKALKLHFIVVEFMKDRLFHYFLRYSKIRFL